MIQLTLFDELRRGDKVRVLDKTLGDPMTTWGIKKGDLLKFAYVSGKAYWCQTNKGLMFIFNKEDLEKVW